MGRLVPGIDGLAVVVGAFHWNLRASPMLERFALCMGLVTHYAVENARIEVCD